MNCFLVSFLSPLYVCDCVCKIEKERERKKNWVSVLVCDVKVYEGACSKYVVSALFLG